MDFRVEPDSCVACHACVRVCPADAVAVEAEKVRIVDESCTRCGLCLPACPHEAIIAVGDLERAYQLACGGRATIILSVESAVHFYPATPEQVVNACYAAGFRTVHRGVLGDELVAREYLRAWNDSGWGTMIRSTCPVIVETVRTKYPELIPYLAPVATPIAAEARYLKQMYGPGTSVVYAGVCVTEGVGTWMLRSPSGNWGRFSSGPVCASSSALHQPDAGRAAATSEHGGRTAARGADGGTRIERRLRKMRGLTQLEALARAVAVDRIDLGFVDILPCDRCLDHPLIGPPEGLFWRREIVGATEPVRSRLPVVEESVADSVRVGAVFPFHQNGHGAPAEAVDQILSQIGMASNGKPWDCGACGYATCRAFAAAAALGRTTLKACPPYLDKEATQAHQQAAIDALTGLATFRVLRDRLATETARSSRSGETFVVLFVDLDNFKQVNDRFGHEAGNEVLRGTARECQALIRTTDLAARYGGDEFVDGAGPHRPLRRYRRGAKGADAGGGAGAAHGLSGGAGDR